METMLICPGSEVGIHTICANKYVFYLDVYCPWLSNSGDQFCLNCTPRCSQWPESLWYFSIIRAPCRIEEQDMSYWAKLLYLFCRPCPMSTVMSFPGLLNSNWHHVYINCNLRLVLSLVWQFLQVQKRCTCVGIEFPNGLGRNDTTTLLRYPYIHLVPFFDHTLWCLLHGVSWYETACKWTGHIIHGHM